MRDTEGGRSESFAGNTFWFLAQQAVNRLANLIALHCVTYIHIVGVSYFSSNRYCIKSDRIIDQVNPYPSLNEKIERLATNI